MAKRRTSVLSSRHHPRRGRSRVKRRKGFRKAALFLVVVAVFSLLSYVELSKKEPEETLNVVPSDYSALADSLDRVAVRALTGLGIHPNWILRVQPKRETGAEGGIYTRTRVKVPVNLPLAICNLEITRAVRQIGGSVIDGTENGLGTSLTLTIGVRDNVTGTVLLSTDPSIQRPEGKVAIIIDDCGESDNGVIGGFLDLDQPLTLSILPNLRASKKIAARAHANGFEVMLHLPMEPHDSLVDPGRDAILVGLTPTEIQERLQEVFASVPNTQGVNNHMGSKATENETVMETVLAEVKRRNLFWVDSMTSPRSLAYDAAKKAGLRAARSRIFIDSEPEIEKIEAKMERLYGLATTEGQVVAIGHCRPLTLQILRQALLKLEKRGITFVYASELVE